MDKNQKSAPAISISKELIIKFCEKNHIKHFRLFGSVLRADFNAESDIDVLVEFAPDHVPGLAFFEMQDELSTLFQRDVDLNTPDFFESLFSRASCPGGIDSLCRIIEVMS